MATQRIGGAGPVFGTSDETYGIVENVEEEVSVEETELLDGDSDVYAVDQHTKRTRYSFEYTYKTNAGPDSDDVGSGSVITVPDLAAECYLNRATKTKAKGDYQKIRAEGTSWPDLGS